MTTEETTEELKLKQAYAIYNHLLTDSKKELNRAMRHWEGLQNDVVRVMMIEFAASCDDTVLLPAEKQLLDEMNEKLRAAEDEVEFWRNRVGKLEAYRPHVKYFHARLECDVEMHKLRLSLSKSLSEETPPGSGTRRARAY